MSADIAGGIVLPVDEKHLHGRWSKTPGSGYPLLSEMQIPFFPGRKRQERVRPEYSLEELLLRPQLTETEAAWMLGITAKALGNMRRARKLPRKIYKQNGKGHKAVYLTKEFLDYFGNQNKPVKNR